MMIFRFVLIIVWAVLMYFTILPMSSEGLAMAGEVFSSDVSAFNWRSQFNVDLLSHMLLAGTWVAWRHKFSIPGVLLALLCICGGLFTLVYVLALTFIHKGDLIKVVMGKNAVAEGA